MIGAQFTFFIILGLVLFLAWLIPRLGRRIRREWERVSQEVMEEEQEQQVWHSRKQEAEAEVARIYRADD